jgi:hypothetical protein
MGGKGNCALPAPNNSPRAHANRSSYPKLLRRSAIRVLSVAAWSIPKAWNS